MNLTIYLFLAVGSFLLGVSDAAGQSNAYLNLMRTQNQQMMNRVRIYSNARSGGRITRYGSGHPGRRRRVAGRKQSQVARGGRARVAAGRRDHHAHRRAQDHTARDGK